MSGRFATSSVRGQAIIEAVVGVIVLIPMVLLGIDLAAVVLANSSHDDLVKNAARSAASQSSVAEARAAAEDCFAKFPRSPLVSDVRLGAAVDYRSSGEVVVKSVMTVRLPAGIAGVSTLKFEAQAVEPVVALPADI